MNEARINQIKDLAKRYPKGYLTNKDVLPLVQRIEELEARKKVYSIQKYDIRQEGNNWYMCADPKDNRWFCIGVGDSILEISKSRELMDRILSCEQ